MKAINEKKHETFRKVVLSSAKIQFFQTKNSIEWSLGLYFAECYAIVFLKVARKFIFQQWLYFCRSKVSKIELLLSEESKIHIFFAFFRNCRRNVWWQIS
jgi:hypothetical protein